MIISNTVLPSFISFSHINITIVRPPHHSFIDIYLTARVFQYDLVLSTVQSLFILFSHINISIVRLQHNSFIDICLTVGVLQYDVLPPPKYNPQFETPLIPDSTLYDQLQQWTIHIHMVFSFQDALTPPHKSQFDIPPRIELVMYDHLPHCTTQFQIFFSH